MVELGSSAKEIEACLARITRYDSELVAFLSVAETQAREQARRADEAAARGEWLGVLHGMAIAVKDNIDTAGIPTTSGADFLRENIPNSDATVVRRLKRAGAVIVGKTTLGELVFDVRSRNPLVGNSRNPWHLDRNPGGSSGGSAIAVAAGMAAGALGTDTGGSVRLPAAHTGVSGLRPTHGAISIEGAMPVSPQNDTIGPMARTVADVARIFSALVGYDPADPYSSRHRYENFLPAVWNGVRGLRIGIPRNFFFEDLQLGIHSAIMGVAETLERQGAELVEVTLPGAEATHAQASVLIYADVAAYHQERLTSMRDRISPAVHDRISRGLAIPATEYARALKFQRYWRRTVCELFEDVDLLLTPTTPVEALPNEETGDLHSLTAKVARLTYAGTLASIPGLSVPAGFTASGLPIGALLQARWWNELLLFRAGVAYQSETDWHTQIPTALARE